MKLQLALDDLDFDDATELISTVQEFIDIIEVGTPMITRYGMEPVRRYHTEFPHLEILADTKIMDVGAYVAALAFEAGADYCTVLSVTDISTIKGCVEMAATHGRNVYVDMICQPDIPARVAELEDIGVCHFGVHTGVDQQAQGRTPLDDLSVLTECTKHSMIAVAGGISPTTILSYAKLGPEVIVVGSGITHSENPVTAASSMREALHTVSL
ncbi:3-hexulose-6-phosphate synthase [Propionibacterium australiense]|uniref:3-hexulose-6-phosphate synthase n=1 Tax=Propionibacterium australiense TaxID=119981 RepID=A0A8B3FLF8_9ACTN|nr:3-hexulose-6-phosphate synthase [Propionibacterium australiense]RLP12710.1 3-hexulose-6-phosphate synthase [Propionibacterium australiense]